MATAKIKFPLIGPDFKLKGTNRVLSFRLDENLHPYVYHMWPRLGYESVSPFFQDVVLALVKGEMSVSPQNTDQTENLEKIKLLEQNLASVSAKFVYLQEENHTLRQKLEGQPVYTPAVSAVTDNELIDRNSSDTATYSRVTNEVTGELQDAVTAPFTAITRNEDVFVTPLTGTEFNTGEEELTDLEKIQELETINQELTLEIESQNTQHSNQLVKIEKLNQEVFLKTARHLRTELLKHNPTANIFQEEFWTECHNFFLKNN